MQAHSTYDTSSTVDCLMGADLFAKPLQGQQFLLEEKLHIAINIILDLSL